MKTQTYESVVIVNATLDDSQIEAVSKRVESTISTEGGNILDVEKWGRKRLAYQINKSKNGFYTIFRFEAPTDAIVKIERMYRLDETIIRYLTTVMELKDIANFEKVKHEKTIAVLNVEKVEDTPVKKEEPVVEVSEEVKTNVEEKSVE